MFGGKIRNPYEYPDSTQLQGEEFQIKKSFLFWKTMTKSQKRHISKTTKIWAVIFGGKICNSWEYPDSTHLQGKAFQILKKKSNFLKI